MSGVIWHVTISLDGFIAAPDDSMDWVVQGWGGSGDDERNIRADKSSVADEIVQSTGAVLAGRRWYDLATENYYGIQGIYGGAWTGPVFVLTHRPPEGEQPRRPPPRRVRPGAARRLGHARIIDAPGGAPVRLERTTLADSGQLTDLRFRFLR